MTTERATLRLATYARVSSDDQAERGTIATQVTELDRWLERHPEYDSVERYADDGVSGTVPLGARPAGTRLIRDAAAAHWQVLLVYQVDRLGRDAVDLLTVRRLLDSLGVKLVSVVEGEPDLLGYDVQAVVADHYRREFLRRSGDGMNRAAREGRYCGGIIPYGYRIEGHKEQARPVPDERIVAGEFSAADVVRRIYQRVGLDGLSCRAVALELNALGIPTHYRRCSTMPDLPLMLKTSIKLYLNGWWMISQMALRKKLYDLGLVHGHSKYYRLERALSWWYWPREDLPGWTPRAN